MIVGIDVSSLQHPGGARIDWAVAIGDLRARGGGADPFVFVKTTEGTGYINPFAAADIAAALAHTPNVGSYDFDHPGDDPGHEVAWYRAHSPALKVNVCDGEVTDKLTMAEVSARIQAWLSLEPADLLYSYPAFLAALPGAPWGHPLWLADPNHPPGQPSRPCLIQQYGQGAVLGIPGPVDLNVWLGDAGGIDAFFAGAAPTPGGDMPGAHDVTCVLVPPPGHPNHGSAWSLRWNGEVDTDTGLSFYGSYLSLPPQLGTRGFPVMTIRPDGAAGYVLWGNDGSRYQFGPAAAKGMVAVELPTGARLLLPAPAVPKARS